MMNRTAALVAMTLMVTVLAAPSALARGAHRPRSRPPGGISDAPIVVDPQDPIEWMTDYDAACKLAAEEKRALLILITTPEVDAAGRFCSFAANSLRRAVRESKVVPLKLLPPVMLDTSRLKPEEVKQRQEVFKKAMEQYQNLARGFGVATVPSLVYAAPDAAKMVVQSTPPDQDIAAALARLPDMLKAYEEAVAKAGDGAKPPPAGDGNAPAKPDGDGPKQVKPPEPAKPPTGGKPAGGDDDF